MSTLTLDIIKHVADRASPTTLHSLAQTSKDVNSYILGTLAVAKKAFIKYQLVRRLKQRRTVLLEINSLNPLEIEPNNIQRKIDRMLVIHDSYGYLFWLRIGVRYKELYEIEHQLRNLGATLRHSLVCDPQINELPDVVPYDEYLEFGPGMDLHDDYVDY